MDVERAYRERIAAMPPAERVRRAEALFNWSREFVLRRILVERGPLSRRELLWELAYRQYGGSPRTRAWLDRLRARDSR